MDHDLGHTPVGHVGEATLDQLSESGFAHAEQSLRIVERLEKEGSGVIRPGPPSLVSDKNKPWAGRVPSPQRQGFTENYPAPGIFGGQTKQLRSREAIS